jgi:4-hydroxy-3-polyprenylbenzoate decarboxylase
MTTDGRTAQKPVVTVAISGASGAVYGIRALELLAASAAFEVHLIASKSAALTIKSECGRSVRDVERLADVVHRPTDIGASIASGSFPVTAMLVVPCSIKTLSAIAYGATSDLISRAGDVCLKEGRPLLLMVRETPLHLGHLRAMTLAAEAGAIIAPPVPAFYQRPVTVEEIVEHTVGRALARVGLPGFAPKEWGGIV